jgi:hypothetical protein
MSISTDVPLSVRVKSRKIIRRSQWPHGLRHELSSLARKLGSWVRIPHSAWMSVCAFILYLCCSVYVAALRRADHSSKVSWLCEKDYETEEEARAQHRAVEPFTNE